MQTHTHTHTHAHTHTHTHTHTHKHPHTHTHRHAHTNIHSRTDTHRHTHAYIDIHTYKHTNSHAHTHTHTNTHLTIMLRISSPILDRNLQYLIFNDSNVYNLIPVRPFLPPRIYTVTPWPKGVTHGCKTRGSTCRMGLGIARIPHGSDPLASRPLVWVRSYWNHIPENSPFSSGKLPT